MTDEWIPALGRYAGRLHAAAGGGHAVASPLGAWLLLALTASAGSSSPAPSSPAEVAAASDGLAEALGVEPERAAEVAQSLLAEPHPLVAAASAVWFAQQVDPGRLSQWRASLPATTEFGPLPDAAGLDRWARENTFGLIDRFPITPSPQILLMLASALATRVSWDNPFDVVPASELGGGPWADRLTRVLRTPAGGHTSLIATSRAAGPVIVHAAPATDDSGAGLEVVSVAAAPEVEPERVLAAAYEIAPLLISGRGSVPETSLFDLPLGEGPLWTIREERAAVHAAERVSAVLPSWSATSDHDLSAPELGFGAATRALEPVLGVSGLRFEARQSATATFSRYGFEAAAVTGFAVLTSMPAERTVRVGELRFAHPYAVVAMTTGRGPWGGVPVFSAWVSEPSDAGEDE